MATERSSSAEISTRLLTALLREREVQPRAALIAQSASELFPGSAAVVYVIEDQEDPKWSSKAVAGEIHLDEAVLPLDSGTLGVLAEEPQAIVFAGSKLAREDYAHLHSRRTVQSLAYVPLLTDGTLIGALEVVTFDAAITEEDVASLIDLAEPAGVALAAALEYERERNSQLGSVSRLAQLYDLEKVFNSTPEMDTLLPIVAAKFREILNVQAVNLWLVQDENEIILLNRDGEDPTIPVDTVQKSGEGIAAEVSDSGQPLIISEPEDERLKQRNAQIEEGAVFSLMAVPIVAQENEVGVVEAINKLDGTPFDEDDLFLLTAVAETAANALHNASLLQAERKVEILETLVTVSQEITSTLDLTRVMQAIVNGPQAVIPYERAAIAIEQSGRLRMGAVSGMKEINTGDPQIKALDELLQWASLSSDEIYVRQHGDEINDPREETKAKFKRYFSESGMNGFFALPLIDDSGRVGVLAFESSDPDFLTEAHLEMAKVLAGQATVALRNAQMYKEVPFIGLLEPVLQKKRKFMALQKRRRQMIMAAVTAAVVFLVLCPLPMRVDGDATVAPAHTAQVMPEVEGVVKAVYVREGTQVKQGQVLADLEPWNYQAELAAARAKYETALSEMNRALATNEGTEAGVRRVQADFWGAEVKRAQERLDRTHLRSPIDGVVSTPHVENFVGKHLALGDSFAEVLDSSQATVDVAIDETEAPLLRAGERAAIKLEGFPTRTFRGDVTVVSPKASVVADRRVFFARVALRNDDKAIRAGMQGRGKVSTGWHPAGYVFLRGPGLWLYSQLWSWFGW